MIAIRKSDDRGAADLGWLRSRATFSFGGYQDPNFVGFRALRVLNEDRIAPGKGFGPHSHRDMEILTYMIEGRLRHRDHLTGTHVLGRNELQAMSAGDGIVHSEFNASETEGSHSLQIWIDPVAEDLTPSYQQIGFTPEERRGRLRLLAGPDVAKGPGIATINQQAWVYVTEVVPHQSVTHTLEPDRHAWVQVVRGEVTVNGHQLGQGDGAAISDERRVTLAARRPEGAELLLFDLA
jgi:redox-sensitive bicupin YhaK (pirin superfamily)